MSLGLSTATRFSLCFFLGLGGYALQEKNSPKTLQKKSRHSPDLAQGSTAGTFPSNRIELLSLTPLMSFAPSIAYINVCVGYVSPTGREYAIVGLSHGTGFVEVTDPVNPTILGIISGPPSNWREIRTYGHYAYAVSEGGGGIQVMDLDEIDAGVIVYVNNFLAGGAAQTHTQYINEDSGYLYRCGGNSASLGYGLRIHDLADPENPSFVTHWNNGRYIHAVQVVSYFEGPYAGKEIAFCFSNAHSGGTHAALEIVDVTDKSNIYLISFVTYAPSRFSHQGRLSPDRHYLYLNDEFDEAQFGIPSTTHIFDVSSLENAAEVGSFTNGNTSVDHNLYPLGKYIFEANDTSGLRVFDASNPLFPVEIAYFDTHPEDDEPSYLEGFYDNYPYLPSGIILGTDRERGFFIFRLQPDSLQFSYPNGRPELLNILGASLDLQIVGNTNQSMLPGTAKLHYKVAGDYVETDLEEISPDHFRASFPALPCGSAVSYYFSAQSSDGVIWQDPVAGAIAPHVVRYGTNQTLLAENLMEADNGWTVGIPEDDATRGLWVRVDSIGSMNATGYRVQTEYDHSEGNGTQCWVTGQGIGAGPGNADVDLGQTTLVSATFDLSSSAAHRIGYWRWHYNDSTTAGDAFRVDISNDNGQSWINVETVFPGGPNPVTGWFYHEFRVEDFVPATDQMKIRFTAADRDDESLVEAAIDDFRIWSFSCGCDGNVNLVSSNPANDAIDARQPSQIDRSNVVGWQSLTLTFDTDVSSFAVEDFSILQFGGNLPAPGISFLEQVDANTITLNLYHPISPAAWTTIRHNCSGEEVRFGYLPGDVNGDGASNPIDILALIDALNSIGLTRPIYSTDINRSGAAEPSDILREIDLLNGADAFDVWNGVALP